MMFGASGPVSASISLAALAEPGSLANHWTAMDAFVTEVGGIVPLATHPLDDADVHAHVGEEAPDRSLRDADFFLGEPGRISAVL